MKDIDEEFARMLAEMAKEETKLISEQLLKTVDGHNLTKEERIKLEESANRLQQTVDRLQQAVLTDSKLLNG